MKFKDLPIGTKFLDDIEINILGNTTGLIKVSETRYNYADKFFNTSTSSYIFT